MTKLATKPAEDRPEPSREPRLVPTAEEFSAWAQHPVTRWVAAKYEHMARAQQDEWMKASWLGGKIEPLALCELRTRADAYMAFLETGWSDYAVIGTKD